MPNLPVLTTRFPHQSRAYQQYGASMVPLRRLPMGNDTLRIRHRSRQGQHYPPNLEPDRAGSDPAVRQVDDRAVQADGGEQGG